MMNRSHIDLLRKGPRILLVAAFLVASCWALLSTRVASAQNPQGPSETPTYYVKFSEYSPQTAPMPSTAPMQESQGAGLPGYPSSQPGQSRNWHRCPIWLYEDPSGVGSAISEWTHGPLHIRFQIVAGPSPWVPDANVDGSSSGPIDAEFYAPTSSSTTALVPLPGTFEYVFEIPTGASKADLFEHCVDIVAADEASDLDGDEFEELTLQIVGAEIASGPGSNGGVNLILGPDNATFRVLIQDRP